MTDSTSADTASADNHANTAQRAREVFVAAKRHDLRTPINAIIGYSEILLEDAEEDGESWAEDLQKIHRAGQSMLATVNETLSAARLESGDTDTSDMTLLGEQIHLELRNDINAAVGYSEMLIEGEPGLGKEALSDLGRIKASALRMTDLINDIVGFGTGQAEGTLADHSQPDQATMVEGVVATLHELDARRTITSDAPGHILIVDDDETNRDLLSRGLDRDGHTFEMAENGREAVDLVRRSSFDVIMLDIMMPVMDGYQTLQLLQSDEELRHIPVIMLSALDQTESVARCIEMGADDFLPKPFDPVLLRARLGSSLEKKRLRDREQEYVEQLRIERAQSEKLLLNILPVPIADRLKRGESTIADGFADVTVLFANLVGFTAMSSQISATRLVQSLNRLFSAFDSLAIDLGVEKVKTIGDAYMVVGGLPIPQPDHADRIVDMAVGMLGVIETHNATADKPLGLRIGINTGPVVAGVISTTKFAYDLWGDAVNVASRMESTGISGRIQVSPSTYALVQGDHSFEPRGEIEVKGKGKMQTYFLTR